MRRLVLALAISLGLTAAVSGSVAADIGVAQTNQAILSCNDGHSVVLGVDPTTLSTLTAEVQAINASGAGLSCTLNTTTTDPSAGSPKWTVYDYNPSGHAIAPRNSPNSMPATTTGGTTTFNFIPGKFTALLTTTDPSLTGDLSSKSLTDTVTWSGTGGFSDQNGDGCGTPPNVRFYFASPSASGPSTGTPPAGFYTHFWWSNPDDVVLTGDAGTGRLTATLTEPSSLTQWSDWNGQPASEFPEAFLDATQKVQTIGLSFGGGCFFENGVTTTTGGTFTSTFSEG